MSSGRDMMDAASFQRAVEEVESSMYSFQRQSGRTAMGVGP
jgi:hypothetical protein